MSGIIHKMHTRGRVTTIAISVDFSLLFLRTTISWVLMLELNVSLIWLRLYAVLTCRSAAWCFIVECVANLPTCVSNLNRERQSEDWRLKMGDKSKWKRKQKFCINKHFSKRWARTDNYEVTTNSWMVSPRRTCVENTDILLEENRTANISTRRRISTHTPSPACASAGRTKRSLIFLIVTCMANGPSENERHSIPAYDIFFSFFALWSLVLCDHGQLPEMTCQEVINAEQIHNSPACRPPALSSFHRSCSQIPSRYCAIGGREFCLTRPDGMKNHVIG